MIHAITLPVDELIQITDFGSEFRIRATFIAEPNERSILIEPAVSAPISIIEIEEDFVPNDERILWTTG